MKVKDVPLVAVMQLLEDKYGLKFVVRDYGILATTPARAQEAGYMPVVEFTRLGTGGEPAAGRKVSDAGDARAASPKSEEKPHISKEPPKAAPSR